MVREGDFVGIVQVQQHAVVLGLAVVVDDLRFFLRIVHVSNHALGVGFGVELGTEKLIAETHGHDGPLVIHMVADFLECHELKAVFVERAKIGLNYLPIARVNGLKGIGQCVEQRIVHAILRFVNRKSAERG